MPAEGDDREYAVLVLTPAGRDAALAARALEQAGIQVVVCEDGETLTTRVAAGAGAALVAEDALSPEIVAELVDILGAQPPWSDFPFLIFTERAATARENQRALETFGGLGNVTALERPLHMLTMISAVRAALRARARQYAARDALEERDREVRQRDQFLAMLGHELRNPLGALRNAAQMLQRDEDTVRRLERPVAVIDRQIHHLTRLVDDLLDVARVTTGKIALQRTPTDLGAVCFGLVEESRRASHERGLELFFEASGGPVFVLGDRVRLEQIVNNLLTNALKYTPTGGRVAISVETSPDDGEAVLRVADTGMGIHADALRSIFEPFTQSERTLDRAQGGMGLGLSVVRTLVRLHGGAVAATSPGLGRGTTFTVRLPLAEPLAPDADDLTPRTDWKVPRRRILIVEDGADNRETLQELLESLGHDVHVAIDGVEGVARALAVRPDIALVDIGLPLIDGFEVARRVRAAVGSEMFLVALTGYGQPEDRARAAAAGFDAHLTKPMDLDVLERMLVTLTADGRSRPAAGASAAADRHAQREEARDVLIDRAPCDEGVARRNGVEREAVAQQVRARHHLEK
ncbi:MAG TPA: hybrid sensor histidine kinase/response regulator [Polyangia bacterium]|jgi:signal transduction histidine kinase/DNA-binding NarL/FixJ family response regulator|nr:hybrid sensor histidine kinase/response regulator [Polyangia bacterium]